MSEVSGAGTIDRDSAPRLSPSAAFVPVGDKGVLYLEDSGMLHRLDHVASVVCARFGGETIAQLSCELAQESGAPQEEVEADLVAFVTQLRALGVLRVTGIPDESARPEPDGESD